MRSIWFAIHTFEVVSRRRTVAHVRAEPQHTVELYVGAGGSRKTLLDEFEEIGRSLLCRYGAQKSRGGLPPRLLGGIGIKMLSGAWYARARTCVTRIDSLRTIVRV